MKKGDIAVITGVAVLSAVSAVLFISGKGGKTVTVSQNNETVYSGSLYTEKTVRLEGNTISISGGTVDVTEADCPDKICKNHRVISKKGESIICLPNRVSIQIK